MKPVIKFFLPTLLSVMLSFPFVSLAESTPLKITEMAVTTKIVQG